MRQDQWRYKPDPKYGGFAVQRKVNFIWFKWWKCEYLSFSERQAKQIVNDMNK